MYLVRTLITGFLGLLKFIGKINTFILVTVIYFSMMPILHIYYRLSGTLNRKVKNFETYT